MMITAKLLLHCPDKPGILADVTDFITVNKGNIVYLDQYVDRVENIFFMRIEWELECFLIPREKIEDYFRASGTQDSGKKDDGGLSGGAVTAITLGSIGGAALVGLGAWMYKRKTEQCLTAGCLRGVQNPIVPFCIERDFNSEFYARINNNYPYLKKALSLNEIHFETIHF